jgi:hypothetical protein
MSIFFKILKYRKFLNKQLKTTLIKKKKYILICDFNNINGLGFKLLRSFLFKNNFKLKLYKNLLSNYFLNISFINTKLIYFKFNKFFSIITFIKLLQNLTIIPFFCFPLIIINQFKNIIYSFNKISLRQFHLITKVNLIKIIFIKFIRKLLLNFILKLLYQFKNANIKSINIIKKF